MLACILITYRSISPGNSIPVVGAETISRSDSSNLTGGTVASSNISVSSSSSARGSLSLGGSPSSRATTVARPSSPSPSISSQLTESELQVRLTRVERLKDQELDFN